jgi:hypothetical protein
MQRASRSSIVWAIGLAMILPYHVQAQARAVTAQEACRIDVEAYIYFYPLVSMDVTRRVMANAMPGSKPMYGPMNTLSHVRRLPDASFRHDSVTKTGLAAATQPSSG